MESLRGTDTGELLKAAVKRADHIRSELVQLREQAVVAAAPAAFEATRRQLPSAGNCEPASTLALAQDEPFAGEQRKVKICPVDSTTTHAGSRAAEQPPAASQSLPLPCGEHGAACKPVQHIAQHSWSIPSAQQQFAAVLGPQRRQSDTDRGMADPLALLPTDAGVAAQYGASFGTESLDQLIAALRAEQAGGRDGALGCLLTESPVGSPAAANRGGVCGVRSSTTGRPSAALPRGQQRQGPPVEARRQLPHLLPSFDPTEAERQLKAKLQQVNAAKRSNDARARPPSLAAPRAPSVPCLPLASLSRSGSGAAGLMGSARREGQENAMLPLQRWPQQQRAGMPGALGSARLASARLQRGPSFADDVGPPNLVAAAQPASAQGDRAAAGPNSGLLRASGKQSRVSLVQLLCSPTSSFDADGARSQPTSEWGSAAFLRAATSDASAAAQAACRGGGGSDCATQQGALSAQAGTAEPLPAAPRALNERPQQAQRIAVAGQRLGPGPAGGTALPGGSAAQPPRYAPPGGWRLASVVDHEAAVSPRLPDSSRLLSRGGGRRLASSHARGLQSPPATPGASAAAPEGSPPRSACSSSGASSSSGCGAEAPRHDRPPGPLGSPVCTLPGLGGQPIGAAAGRGAAAAAVAPAQPGCPTAGGWQQPGDTGTGAGLEQPQPAASASSVGRKRSGSEVGLVGEEPASLKKRSPEVDGGRRSLARASEPGAGSSGAAAAAAIAAELLAAGGVLAPDARVLGVLSTAQLATAGGQRAEAAAQRGQTGQQPMPQGPRAGIAAPRPPTRPRKPPAVQPPPPGSQLVLPVVMMHSPPKHRQRPPPLQQQQEQQQEQRRQPAARLEEAVPASLPAQQETASPAAPAPEPRRGRPVQAAVKPLAGPPAGLGSAAQRQHAEPPPTAQAPPPVQGPAQPPRPVQHQVPVHQEQRQDGQARGVRTGRRGAAVVPPLVLGERGREEDLPSKSSWVATPREAPLGELPSTTRLLSSRRQPRGEGGATSAAARPAPPDQPPSGQQERAGNGAVSPLCSVKPAAVAGQAGERPRACPSPSPSIPTPRRRVASLEPPEAAVRLRDDAYGKQLLAAAPQLAATTGAALLEALGQGWLVRKAWVKPNFKAGGSTRRLQLAPSPGGRLQAAYPHGLLRQPLRVGVKRAVVNSPVWRLGAYLVLDTARGMLRLEPGSAAEYAQWVLALNAAFLASGESGGGGDAATCVQQQPVGDMCWSAAVLFG